MKSTAFLLLSFLLLTLATKSSTANQELVGLPAPVYDIEGNMLRPGTEYYILSAIFGAGGGGLTNGRAPDSPTGCPLDVIQLRSDLMVGRPVIFTPEDSTESAIRVATDLKINFTSGIDPTCVASTTWRVVRSFNSNKQLSIQIKGLVGVPTASKFQIHEISSSGNMYKLTFCPTKICRDLSIYGEDDGTRSLVINGGNPFLVVFQKASESVNPINAE